jgi:hypothetical protein
MLDLIICHLVELTPLYITVTFIPVNELTQFPLVFFSVLLLQLPPEWIDQFASGIQACPHPTAHVLALFGYSKFEKE